MAVQLTADVEHAASLKHLSDHAGAVLVFADQPHQQSAMGGAVGGRVVFAMLAPVSVAVPIEESNQLVIDLVEKSPDPVHPEGLKSLDSGTADERPAALQMRLEPAQAAVGDLLIDVAVLREGDWPTDPFIVRLVPHAPVPIADNITAPLLDTAAYDVAAPVGKFINGLKIIHRFVHLGERNHGLGPGIQYSLYV